MASDRVREWVRALPQRRNRESDISIRTQHSGHTSVDGFTASNSNGNNRPSGFFSRLSYSKNWKLVQLLLSRGRERSGSEQSQGPREGISTVAYNRESVITVGTGCSGHTSVDGPSFSCSNRMSRMVGSRRRSVSSDVPNVRQFLGGERRGSNPECRLSEAGWYAESIHDDNISYLNPALTGQLTSGGSHGGNMGSTPASSPTRAQPMLTTTIGTAAQALGSSHKGAIGKTESPSLDTSLQVALAGENPPEPRPPTPHLASQTSSSQATGKFLGRAWQDDKQHELGSTEPRSTYADDVGSTGPLTVESEGSYLSFSQLQRYDEARSISRRKILLIGIVVFVVLAAVAIVVALKVPGKPSDDKNPTDDQKRS